VKIVRNGYSVYTQRLKEGKSGCGFAGLLAKPLSRRSRKAAYLYKGSGKIEAWKVITTRKKIHTTFWK